ncbi:MAG: hypothetical protein JNM94_17065 [Phycisphaerae bacterium]|nr:hypothetical protein [Phycisphaerae bacterium]
MNLQNRLAKHFAVAATAAAGVAGASNAGVIYSGVVNINIPATTNGLYLNVVNGQINEPGNGGGSTVPGWDINPWSTSFGLFSPTNPSGGAYATLGANLFNLPALTTISAASTFGSLGSTTNNGQWNLNSANNIVGFRFQNEANGNAIHYGWFRVAFGATIGSRTLVEYAYEDVAGGSIAAGAIPAPGAFALLGLAGLSARRRRQS